ncbi:MAG: hypothetical protein AAF654_04415 [Myxococcota bacterium]
MTEPKIGTTTPAWPTLPSAPGEDEEAELDVENVAADDENNSTVPLPPRRPALSLPADPTPIPPPRPLPYNAFPVLQERSLTATPATPPPLVPNDYASDLLDRLDELRVSAPELEPFQIEVAAILDRVDLSSLTPAKLQEAFAEYARDHRLANVEPDAIGATPTIDGKYDQDLRDIEDGARQAHFEVLDVILFGDEADIPGAMESYANSVAQLSNASRAFLNLVAPEDYQGQTFFPLVLPGLFIPPGSSVSWMDNELIVESEQGMYALVGDELVAITEVSLQLSDAENSVGFSTFRQADDSMTAVLGFNATTAGDGNSSLFTADALAYYDGGDHLVFTGIAGGHQGDEAGLFVAGIDVDVEDTTVSGNNGFLTQDPDRVTGGLSNAAINTNGFGLTADQLVFVRTCDEGDRTFAGKASGNVSLSIGNDFTTEAEALRIGMTEVGETSTVSIGIDGPSEGTFAGNPYTASDSLTVTTQMVGGEFALLEGRTDGELRYDFNGESGTDQPVVTANAGFVRLTPDELTIAGERLAYEQEDDRLSGTRLTATFDRVGSDGTQALTFTGWDDGPSEVDGRYGDVSFNTPDFDVLRLERSTETGHLTSGVLRTNGGEISDDGENPFTVRSTGPVAAEFQTHDENGLLSLVRVGGDDFSYADPDWNVDLSDGAGGEVRFTETGDLSHFSAQVGTGRLRSTPESGSPLDLMVSGGNSVELNYIRNGGALEEITFGGNFTRVDLLASEEGTGFANMVSAEGSLYADGSIKHVLLSSSGGEYRDPDGGVFEVANGGHVFINTSSPGQLAEFDAVLSGIGVNSDGHNVTSERAFANGVFGDSRNEITLGADGTRYEGQLEMFRTIGVGQFRAGWVQDLESGVDVLTVEGRDVTATGVHGKNNEYGFTFSLPELTTGRIVAEDGRATAATLNVGPMFGTAYENGARSATRLSFGGLTGEATETSFGLNMTDAQLSFATNPEIDWARDVDVQIGSTQLRGDEVVTSLTLTDAMASGLIRVDKKWEESGFDFDLIQVELFHGEGSVDRMAIRAGSGDFNVGDLSGRVRMPDGQVIELQTGVEDEEFNTLTLSTGHGDLYLNQDALAARIQTEMSGVEIVEPSVYRFTNRNFDVTGSDGPQGVDVNGQRADFRLGPDGLYFEHLEGVHLRLWGIDNEFLGDIDITADMMRNVRLAFADFDERIDGDRIRGFHVGLLPDGENPGHVTLRFTAETDLGDAHVDIRDATKVLASGFIQPNYAQVGVSAPDGHVTLDFGGFITAEGHGGAYLGAGIEPASAMRFARTLLDISQATSENTDGGIFATPSAVGVQWGQDPERFRIGPVAVFGLQPFEGGRRHFQPGSLDLRPHGYVGNGFGRDTIYNPFDLRALGIAINGQTDSFGYRGFIGLTDSQAAFVQGTNLAIAGQRVHGERAQIPLSPTIDGDAYFDLFSLRGLQLGAGVALNPAGTLITNEYLHEDNDFTAQVRFGKSFGPLSVTSRYTQTQTGDQRGIGGSLSYDLGDQGARVSFDYDRFEGRGIEDDERMMLRFEIPLFKPRAR